MIPVFVLSLPDCHDRREAISKRLQDLAIQFEFFDAVDGRQGLGPVWESQIDRRGTHLSDTEFGCALSHIEIYRQIVADAIPYALVLEDDAIPLPDLPRFLAGDYHSGGGLTDLNVWGYSQYVVRGSKRRLFGHYASWLVPPILWKSWGTTGYVIALEAAKYILEHALPVTGPADWPSCVWNLVRMREVRIVLPALITLPPPGEQFPSTIECALRKRQNRIGTNLKNLPRKILHKRVALNAR